MDDFYLTISDMSGFDIIQDNWLSHLKKADCVIIMFDVTQIKSFQLVSDFIKLAKTNSKDKAVVIILIGSKCDRIHNRKIGIEDEKKIAIENDILYDDFNINYNDKNRILRRIVSEISQRKIKLRNPLKRQTENPQKYQKRQTKNSQKDQKRQT